MFKLVQFFLKHRILFVFILLEIAALGMMVQKRSFHRSTILNSSNLVAGRTWGSFSAVQRYFSLKETNELLLDENVKLKSLLQSQLDKNLVGEVSYVIDSNFRQRYSMRSANVIHNSLKGRNNFLTLDVGKKQGVEEGSAVIGPDGVVGIVDKVSSHFCSVISVLNDQARISSRLNKSRYFGSLAWDGDDYRYAKLWDIPREAVLSVGDSLFTNTYSSVFPEGFPVGVVSSFILEPDANFYSIQVKIATNFANLSYVYVVQDLLKGELDSIQTTLEDGQ